MKWISDSEYIYIIVYVDDFVIAATHDSLIDEFCAHLKSKYKITTKPFTSYLGTSIEEKKDGSRVFTRPHQLERLFNKWLPTKSEIYPDTPMTVEYGRQHSHEDSPECDKTEYQSCLGALMQIVDVRPDIAFSVSKCSQRTHDCREVDMKALLRIVCYLKGTEFKGLTLRPGNLAAGRTFLRLRGFCDASYASMSDGRSQIAYGFDLIPENFEGIETSVEGDIDTGQFYSKVSTAGSTALSSTDTELTAIVEATKTAILFRGILAEMHLEQFRPTTIFNDNKSAIMLGTAYSGSHKRVRYILPKITWLMEMVKSEVVNLGYMHTNKLPPDLGTKSLSGKSFIPKRDAVLGLEPVI
jgi:hypothetical protein